MSETPRTSADWLPTYCPHQANAVPAAPHPPDGFLSTVQVRVACFHPHVQEDPARTVQTRPRNEPSEASPGDQTTHPPQPRLNGTKSESGSELPASSHFYMPTQGLPACLPACLPQRRQRNRRDRPYQVALTSGHARSRRTFQPAESRTSSSACVVAETGSRERGVLANGVLRRTV
jgi:hypothetical protein